MKHSNVSFSGRPACASRFVNRVFAAASVCGMTALLAAGCAGPEDPNGYLGDKPIGSKVFAGDDMQTRSMNRIVNAQAAVAARNDSTLHSYNFYGSDLNGLGQQKLDLITLDDRPVNPLVIYMDMPEDTLDARKTTVVAYLKDKGLKDDQIKLEAGPNPSPDSACLAAPGLKTLHLLDGGSPVANPEPATGGAGNGAGANGSGANGASTSGASQGMQSVPGAPPSH